MECAVCDLFPLLGDSVAADMVVFHLTRAQSMTTRSPLLYVRDGIEQHAPDAYLTALVMLEFIFFIFPKLFSFFLEGFNQRADSVVPGLYLAIEHASCFEVNGPQVYSVVLKKMDIMRK